MRFFRRDTVILTLVAVICFLTVSCGESKVKQCNKIIQIANQAADQSNKVTEGGKKTNPEALLKTAEAMDKAAQDMKALKVNDQKLQAFQKGFTNMYRDTSKILRDYVAAFEKQDHKRADTAIQSFNKKAIKPSENLVNDINRYCKT